MQPWLAGRATPLYCHRRDVGAASASSSLFASHHIAPQPDKRRVPTSISIRIAQDQPMGFASSHEEWAVRNVVSVQLTFVSCMNLQDQDVPSHPRGGDTHPVRKRQAAGEPPRRRPTRREIALHPVILNLLAIQLRAFCTPYLIVTGFCHEKHLVTPRFLARSLRFDQAKTAPRHKALRSAALEDKCPRPTEWPLVAHVF